MKRFSKQIAIFLLIITVGTVMGNSQLFTHTVSAQADGRFKPQEAMAAFEQMVAEDSPIAMVKRTYSIKERTNTASAVVKSVPTGYQVQLQSVVFIGYEVWYKVQFAVDGTLYYGYIENENIATTDTAFMNWKQTYEIDAMSLASGTKERLTRAGRSAADIFNGTTADDLALFPESYRPLIQQLVKAHPNWTFVPFNTGLDWKTVITNEMKPKTNLVPMNSSAEYKSKDPQFYDAATNTWYPQDSGSWAQASKLAVEYYMDPRHFLNETSVFQYELLTYNTNHTESGVESILSGTFMSKKILEDKSAGTKTYGKVFMELGENVKVSPYFLASRVRQEQGVQGDSPLISGKYSGYAGYYNYFNFGATGNSKTEVIVNGLAAAKKAKWTTRYLALSGGAAQVANQYIKRGQDTLYLQKFDVDGSYDGRYAHQYMQNLMAADTEGKSVRKAYESLGVLNNNFVFKIPVYNNMSSETGMGIIENPVNEGSDTRPAPAPGGDVLQAPVIRSARTAGFNKAALKWENGSNARIEGYQIYLKNGNSAYRLRKTVSSTTKSFTDTGLVPNRTYRYKIRAYIRENGRTRYSTFSSPVTLSTAIRTNGLSPIRTASKSTVTLKWKRSNYVTGYVIYRKAGKGAYRKIKSLTGAGRLFYTDSRLQSRKIYYYKIRAFKKLNGKYYYSAYSAQRKVRTK